MNINYEVKSCSHCNSKNTKVLGNDNQIYGLVSLTSDVNGETIVNTNTVLPVIAIVCKDCGHIELIHINAKAIE